jgi:hypothetical protein
MFSNFVEGKTKKKTIPHFLQQGSAKIPVLIP